MRTRILFELKRVYEPFSVLWHEWTNCADCLLNADEVYMLEVHRMNHFQMGLDDFVLHYSKRENTLELIRKLSLKSQYRRYTDFIIGQFGKELLHLIYFNKSMLLPWVPIQLLSASNEQKASLLKFGKKTVGEIINDYTTNDLRKPELFMLIRDVVKLRNYEG